jgi:hypothetical protein
MLFRAAIADTISGKAWSTLSSNCWLERFGNLSHTNGCSRTPRLARSAKSASLVMTLAPSAFARAAMVLSSAWGSSRSDVKGIVISFLKQVGSLRDSWASIRNRVTPLPVSASVRLDRVRRSAPRECHHGSATAALQRYRPLYRRQPKLRECAIRQRACHRSAACRQVSRASKPRA